MWIFNLSLSSLDSTGIRVTSVYVVSQARFFALSVCVWFGAADTASKILLAISSLRLKNEM